MFISLRDHQTVFHSYHTILHSYQQCTRVPIPPGPHQHWLISAVLTVAILTGGRRYLILVLIFLSLMTSDVEYLIMCLLATGISLGTCQVLRLFKN